MKVLLSIFVLLTFYISSCSNRSKKVKITEVTLADRPMTRAFINFWKDFSIKFNSVDTASIKKITLDTIWLWGDRVSSTDFIKRYHNGYLSSDFSKIILDTNKTSYSSIGCYPSPPVPEAIKVEFGDAFNCQDVTIRDTLGVMVKVLEFSFLNTTKGYMLIEIKNYSYSWSRDDPRVDTTKPLR